MNGFGFRHFDISTVINALKGCRNFEVKLISCSVYSSLNKPYIIPGVGKLFHMADRYKSKKFLRAGLKHKYKYSAIKFYFSSFYNSD